MVVPPLPWQSVAYMPPPWAGHPWGWWYEGGFCPSPTRSPPEFNEPLNDAFGSAEAGLASEQPVVEVDERKFKRDVRSICYIHSLGLRTNVIEQVPLASHHPFYQETLVPLYRDEYRIAVRSQSHILGC